MSASSYLLKKDTVPKNIESIADIGFFITLIIRSYFLYAYYSQNSVVVKYGSVLVLSLLFIVSLFCQVRRQGPNSSLPVFFLIAGIAIAMLLQIQDAGHAIELYLTVLLGLLIKKRGIKPLLIITAIVVPVILLVHVICLLCGIVPPGELFNRAGQIRRSYGFMHPNSMGAFVLFGVMSIQVLTKKPGVTTACSLCTTVLLYYLSGTRTVLVVGLMCSLIPLVSALIKRINPFGVLAASYPALFAVNIVLAGNASDSTSLINQLSGQHYLSAFAYLDRGIALFGGKGFIESSGSPYAWLQSNFEYIPLDNYYIFILTQWGLLISVACCVLWVFMIRTKTMAMSPRLMAALVVTLLLGCISVNPIYPGLSLMPALLGDSYYRFGIYCTGRMGKKSRYIPKHYSKVIGIPEDINFVFCDRHFDITFLGSGILMFLVALLSIINI